MSAALNAIENLTANFEFFYFNAGSDNPTTNTKVDTWSALDSKTSTYVTSGKYTKLTETAKYRIGAIEPGVVAYEWFYSADTLPSSLWNVKPLVNYYLNGDNTVLTGQFKYGKYLTDGATAGTDTSNYYVVDGVVKQVFNANTTAWVGAEYGNNGAQGTAGTKYFSFFLSAAFSY